MCLQCSPCPRKKCIWSCAHTHTHTLMQAQSCFSLLLHINLITWLLLVSNGNGGGGFLCRKRHRRHTRHFVPCGYVWTGDRKTAYEGECCATQYTKKKKHSGILPILFCVAHIRAHNSAIYITTHTHTGQVRHKQASRRNRKLYGVEMPHIFLVHLCVYVWCKNVRHHLIITNNDSRHATKRLANEWYYCMAFWLQLMFMCVCVHFFSPYMTLLLFVVLAKLAKLYLPFNSAPEMTDERKLGERRRRTK